MINGSFERVLGLRKLAPKIETFFSTWVPARWGAKTAFFDPFLGGVHFVGFLDIVHRVPILNPFGSVKQWPFLCAFRH